MTRKATGNMGPPWRSTLASSFMCASVLRMTSVTPGRKNVLLFLQGYFLTSQQDNVRERWSGTFSLLPFPSCAILAAEKPLTVWCGRNSVSKEIKESWFSLQTVISSHMFGQKRVRDPPQQVLARYILYRTQLHPRTRRLQTWGGKLVTQGDSEEHSSTHSPMSS